MTPPDDFDPIIGLAETLENGVRRIVAPNPSPMTYRGTNTYIVGTRDLAVIDPGPKSDTHLQAILDAVGADQKITHIIVTHTHLDHSPLARLLATATGAPIFAFGDATAGRSDAMIALAASGMVGGGEGIDVDFQPDQTVEDGDFINGSDWQLEVIHTPGHIGNHICLSWNDLCFTADHVMGWASSLVSPPDGDVTDFMESCAKLEDYDWRVFYPGHGAAINDPSERLDWLIDHRLNREAAILDLLEDAPATARELAKAIYTDTPPALLGAATRNVLAHLIDLVGQTEISAIGAVSEDAQFLRL
ncbi:MAG: glyoxylase-like metal-dependent hydrolase (beta-lactamase superfamily II) [Candidatus Azotimanducaceae bacterium]|jgi:glyoxylase-like metal-dependent hydrolase (beta-lactamase superfamily II)